MASFEEITQDLLAPELDIFGIDREPPFPGHYQTSTKIVNTLAHLLAVEGKRSRLIACDADGVLPVRIRDSDGTDLLDVDSSGLLKAGIWQGGTQADVKADAFADGTENGLYVSSYKLKLIHNILDDVWDSTNHYLRTHETA